MPPPTGPTTPRTTRTTTPRTTKETSPRPGIYQLVSFSLIIHSLSLIYLTDGWTPPPVEDNNNKLPLEFNEHGERLIFRDDFDKLDLSVWKHDITMSGGGNWEFQLYHNNRTNSFVKDGVLYIKPTLTAERIGEANLKNNFRMDMWGGSPADQCTGNNFYGCERMSGM